MTVCLIEFNAPKGHFFQCALGLGAFEGNLINQSCQQVFIGYLLMIIWATASSYGGL